MNEIFEIEDLKELELYLKSQFDTELLREILFVEFLKYADYKNATQWNKAVRVCESLAIVGWGEHEPLEALRGIYFNGNPMTYFLNKMGQVRYVDAIWSKRTTGLTMQQGRTSYYSSSDDPKDRPTLVGEYATREEIQDVKLESQRNWIPKNPIWIERTISNCYSGSQKLIESIDKELQIELNVRMRPELYGRLVNRLVFICSHSYFDHEHCKTNFIISSDDKKLSDQKAWEELHKMFSKEEIEKNGYFLRNRFVYGPFKSNTGKMTTTIHFEKQFSEMDFKEQKKQFSQYILTALSTIIDKQKKKLDYNFDLMFADFRTILTDWNNKD